MFRRAIPSYSPLFAVLGVSSKFRRSTSSFPDLETKTFPSKFRFNLVSPIRGPCQRKQIILFSTIFIKIVNFHQNYQCNILQKQARLIMHLNCDSLKNLKIFNFEGSGKYSSSYYNVIFLGILWRQLLPRKTRQEIAIAHRFSLDLITIFRFLVKYLIYSDILAKARLFGTKTETFRKIN